MFVSNLPFIAVGAVGLRQFHRDPAIFVIFLGTFLTGFGSSYYHWHPNDSTLFWDRLPMTLCFMAILAVVVEERASAKLGAILLWPLLATGIFSLLLWRSSGDLRLYGWVQFFPALAVPLLLLLFPPQYTGTFCLVTAGALYALAKLFELLDHAVIRALSSADTQSSICSVPPRALRCRDIFRCAGRFPGPHSCVRSPQREALISCWLLHAKGRHVERRQEDQRQHGGRQQPAHDGV